MTTENDKGWEERYKHEIVSRGIEISAHGIFVLRDFIRQEILKAVEGERESIVNELREKLKDTEMNCEKECGPLQKFKSNGCIHLWSLLAQERAIQIITNRKQHGTGDKEGN